MNRTSGHGRLTSKSAEAALACVSAWGPAAAAVLGSGLAALPVGATLDEEFDYAALGWPCSAVAGHASRLKLLRMSTPEGREVKLALACGRPHRYEGWSDAELGRSVGDLSACGVRRLVLTNASGSLRSTPGGTVVVCDLVVDLQVPPTGSSPDVLTVCTRPQATQVADAVAGVALPTRVGAYVAVAGPQFETPAEARWLSRHGDVVGMSAAPEVRAAHAAGVACLLLSLVVNQSADAGSHEDVLATAGRLSARFATALLPAAQARWPDLT